MGIRITEITAGANCSCHPIPVGTPDKVYILFDGMTQCPGKQVPPNGTTFVCHQDSVNPCLFYSVGGGLGFLAAINFFCAINQVAISLWIIGDGVYFNSVTGLPIAEYDQFSNIFGGCAPAQLAFGGTATPFWLSSVMDLVDALEMPTDGDGLFLESFYVSATEIVHRLANRTYSINHMSKISI